MSGLNEIKARKFVPQQNLMKKKQHIQSVLVKQSNQDKIEYRVQLNAIVDCIRFLLCRGLAFRGTMNLKVQVIKEISLSFYNFGGITMNLSMKCCKKLRKIASLPTMIFKKTL